MFDIELKMNKGEFSVKKDIEDIDRTSNDIVKRDIMLDDDHCAQQPLDSQSSNGLLMLTLSRAINLSNVESVETRLEKSKLQL